MSKQAIEKLLKDAGSIPGKKDFWTCPFPAHNDTNPSFKIKILDGKWGYYCFGCGEHGDIYDLEDLVKQRAKGTAYKEKNGKPMQKATQKAEAKIYTLKEIENAGRAYRYTNPDTNRIELIVLRRPRGSTPPYVQYRPESGGYITGGLSRLPLLNRGAIRNTSVVVVVEGEKDVEALHRVGIVATTKPCGSQRPDLADWTPLYGKKVFLWPDNDEPGLKYMEAVKELLRPHCDLYWIDPRRYGLGDKQDAYDYLEKIGWNRDVARLPLDEAVPCGAAKGVADE
ncbi:hypothetical protein LCGC14_1991940, partial [marine sediment metagenome]